MATAVPRATSEATLLHGSSVSGESFCDSAASPPLEVTRWAALWRKTTSPRASDANDDARSGPPPLLADRGHVCV